MSPANDSLQLANFSCDSNFQELLETLPIGFGIHNRAGQLLYLNRAGRRLFEFDGSLPLDLTALAQLVNARPVAPPGPPCKARALPVARAIARGKVQSAYLELRGRSGGARLVDWLAVPRIDEGGRVAGAICCLRPVPRNSFVRLQAPPGVREASPLENRPEPPAPEGDRETARPETRATADDDPPPAGSAAQPEAAIASSVRPIQAMPVGILVYDSGACIRDCNDLALTLLDMPRSRAIGRHLCDLDCDWMRADGRPMQPDDCPIARAIARRRVIRDEVIGLRHVDGRQRWLLMSAAPQQDEAGNATGAIAALSDITALKNAEIALRAERDLLDGITRTSFAAITVLDPQGNILYANESAERVLGLTRDEIRHRTYNSPEWRPTALDGGPWPDECQPFRRVLATRQPAIDVQHAIEWPDGQRKYLSVNGAPVLDAAGNLTCLVFSVTDITERLQADAALRESEERFRLLAENTNDLICLHDLSGCYQYLSPSCKALLGYSGEELLGQPGEMLIHPADRDRVRQEFRRSLATQTIAPITYRARHRSGRYLWLETLTKPIADASGAVVQLQTTSRDVTEKIRVQEQLQYEALHDGLTGLANRNLLMERLELALARIKHDPTCQFAVLFLDLDRFKKVNDSLGHEAGDRLLISVAQKLVAELSETDLAARLGGDEFLLLLEDIRGLRQAIATAQHLLKIFAEPEILDGRPVFVTASIGIALGNPDYANGRELLRDADIAMYRAKDGGKARYEIFNPRMHAELLRAIEIEADLRQAIAHQNLILHYQPIVSLADERLLGFESLVRWEHPTKGRISPGDFVPVAEETGLIVPVGDWVLAEACRQMAAWQARYPAARSLKVNVNLSARQLSEPDLIDRVDRALKMSGLAGECLTLEIVESMLVDNIEATIPVLKQLRDRGIQIAIDDFGTGYSSLSYLHRLPATALKIDRAFVSRADTCERDRDIAATIVTLSNRLRLDAVAEGIETRSQLDQLRELGCECGQGYLFSPPLPAEAIAPWLENDIPRATPAPT